MRVSRPFAVPPLDHTFRRDSGLLFRLLGLGGFRLPRWLWRHAVAPLFLARVGRFGVALFGHTFLHTKMPTSATPTRNNIPAVALRMAVNRS